jgi:hypothetical protein
MKKSVKTSAKKSNKKNVSRGPVASRTATGTEKHPLKVDQTVKYDGKKFRVKRAYFYDGRALAIITDGKNVKAKMVSAKSCA